MRRGNWMCKNANWFPGGGTTNNTAQWVWAWDMTDLAERHRDLIKLSYKPGSGVLSFSSHGWLSTSSVFKGHFRCDKMRHVATADTEAQPLSYPHVLLGRSYCMRLCPLMQTAQVSYSPCYSVWYVTVERGGEVTDIFKTNRKCIVGFQ